MKFIFLICLRLQVWISNANRLWAQNLAVFCTDFFCWSCADRNSHPVHSQRLLEFYNGVVDISTAPRIKRFDGSNFLEWKNWVYTELQCEDLTELVDKKPTEEQLKRTCGTDKKPWTWVQADARACRIIIKHLDNLMLHYAPNKLSAYEIWRWLRVTYNRTSYLQHAYLWRKLSNLQFDGRLYLSSFFKEFDDEIAEIRAGGGKVGKFEDVEAVATLLAALPSSFSPVVASLGEINDSLPITLEFLKGLLLDFDLKQNDEMKSKKGNDLSE